MPVLLGESLKCFLFFVLFCFFLFALFVCLFVFAFYFLLFWNHWNLFWIFQNGTSMLLKGLTQLSNEDLYAKSNPPTLAWPKIYWNILGNNVSLRLNFIGLLCLPGNIILPFHDAVHILASHESIVDDAPNYKMEELRTHRLWRDSWHWKKLPNSSVCKVWKKWPNSSKP